MTRATLVEAAPWLALVCWAAFAATVAAMPMLKDGYSPVDDAISYGAIGPYGGVQVAGFFALAAGTSILAHCLRSTGSQPVVIALLALSAIAVAGLAVVPIDGHGQPTTATGRVHSSAASIAFLSTVAAMLWSARSFARGQALAPLVPSSFGLGCVAVTLLVALSAGIGPAGLVQRATVLCEIVWLSLVALQLRPVNAPSHARPVRQA